MTPAPPAPHPAAAVELLALDVDGVMTDGSILLDDHGVETKRFHVRDGFAIKLWQRLGFHVAIVTGRRGRVVEHRARELGITLAAQGSGDKWADLHAMLETLRLGPERAAFLGDDWPDLAPMRRVAYPMAVADADARVKAAARLVTASPGGRGAVREAVEHLLGAKGLMDRAAALYDPPT